MIPVVTPDEMRAIDAAAPEPVDELIRRAGAAVARAAIDMLGGTYGRVVNVIAGTGNNGADGRDAARRLAARGVGVRVFDAAACPPDLPAADLVIDAAYGTGYPPRPGAPLERTRDRWSGSARRRCPQRHRCAHRDTPDSGVLPADRTVSFQALKPGLLFGRGAALAGDVAVVDIGLNTDHICLPSRRSRPTSQRGGRPGRPTHTSGTPP